MSHRTNVHHVEDMIEYGERAVRYLSGLTLAELVADQMRSDAVVRTVEIMGEACKRLPAEVKDRFPTVPWKKIARTRDKLVHYYEGVDWAVVWKIAAVHVPSALTELRTIRDTLLVEEPPPPEMPADA